jgi:hypothetical protein
MGVIAHKSALIMYFEKEGRENLPQVLRAVKKAFNKRPELRELKLVMLTANGEGPAIAYARLHEFAPKIIAVTFPPDFTVTRGEQVYSPQIPERLGRFFEGVGIKVITNRLPFDSIGNAQAHNADMHLIKDVLTIFGGGFSLCIQATLSACDHGLVAIGEKVLAITGDTAAIISASTTEKFVSKTQGLVVNEILCKPRNLTISRKTITPVVPKPLLAEPSTAKVIDMATLAPIKPLTKIEP